MGFDPNRTTFTFDHVDQVDEYGPSVGNFVTVQQAFDSRAEENLDDINNIKTVLAQTTDGDSGADNVAATTISGVSGATVQALLEAIKDLADGKADPGDYYTQAVLNAITDSDSGADKIGSTAITGVTGTTVQSQLESLKTIIDSLIVGSIPDNSLTEAKMASDMKKQAGGVYPYNDGANNTTDIATNASDIVTNTTAITLNDLRDLVTTTCGWARTNKDSNDIYTTVTFTRSDSTTAMVSQLSGGTSPEYTTKVETYYLSNGTTVDRTATYTITWSGGEVISETLTSLV